MNKVFFDKSITVPLFARKGDSGNSIILSFFDENGFEFSIEGFDWTFPIYKRGSEKPLLTLSEGNGLQILGTNGIRIQQEFITLDPETYFYKLINNFEHSTWLAAEFTLYGNLEKDVLSNKKSITIGPSIINMNMIAANVFLGGVQMFTVTDGVLDFDHQREIYFVDNSTIGDTELTFINSAQNKRFLYIFRAAAGTTLLLPDNCTSKSAYWNGDVIHSFYIPEEDNFILEGIWDNTQFRLIIT